MLEDVWPVTGTGHCGLHGPAGHHPALPGRSVHMEHGTWDPKPCPRGSRWDGQMSPVHENPPGTGGTVLTSEGTDEGLA